MEHCEIGGGHVLPLGPEEGLQVLPQEEIGAVHSRRHRPRPARRSTHPRYHSAHRSRSQRRLHQRQGNARLLIFIPQFCSMLGNSEVKTLLLLLIIMLMNGVGYGICLFFVLLDRNTLEFDAPLA